MFEYGFADIEDAEYKRKPSTATNSKIAAHVNKCMFADRCITMVKISNELDISHGSGHKINMNQLKFNKVCTQ